MSDPAPAGAAAPVPAAVRPVRLFSLCLLAAVVAMSLPLPWRVGAVAFLVTAVYYGVRALIALAGNGRPAQLALVSCVLALSGVLLAVLLVQLALWPKLWEHQQCLDGAITERGRQACDDDLIDPGGSGLLPARR